MLRVGSFDSFFLDRLLRRGIIDKAVFAAQLILAGAMTVLLLHTGATIWDIHKKQKAAIQNLEEQVQPLIESIKNPPKLEPKSKDYGAIATRSLFGPIGAPAAKPAEAPKSATNLPMTLIGTFVVEGEEPYAIIEEQKRKTQDVFLLNDMVFGEAKLVAIFPDHVEINRGGRIETLALDTGESKGGSEAPGGISASGENEFSVDEGELDRALENLPLLLTQARAVPYFKDGRAVGLRLFAIKSGSLFERLGLQNGDVLKTVNGNSLADLSQAMQLFQRLKEERNITVVMERNMVEKEFRYQIR